MLRDKSLIPLSHQHQHALALCVRIDRSRLLEVEIAAFQDEIRQIWETELCLHFEVEENFLFPLAENIEAKARLIPELIAEHARLRSMVDVAIAREMREQDLREFGTTLSVHVRKEERELFEALQAAMTPEQMNELGVQLSERLTTQGPSCATRPNPQQ